MNNISDETNSLASDADVDCDDDELEELEMKISILSKEDSAELNEVVEGLKLIREERLKEREVGASKVIRNKREYIRHIFNEAINRIISQKLSTVRVKIADLGNACFEVRGEFLWLIFVGNTPPLSLFLVPPLHGGHSDEAVPVSGGFTGG